MDLKFEIGSSASPRGHALVYFIDASDPSKIGASYIVVLPVNVDIAKYVPPFLAGQIESIGGSDLAISVLSSGADARFPSDATDQTSGVRMAISPAACALSAFMLNSRGFMRLRYTICQYPAQKREKHAANDLIRH